MGSGDWFIRDRTAVRERLGRPPAFEQLEARVLLSADVLGVESIIPLDAPLGQQALVTDADRGIIPLPNDEPQSFDVVPQDFSFNVPGEQWCGVAIRPSSDHDIRVDNTSDFSSPYESSDVTGTAIDFVAVNGWMAPGETHYAQVYDGVSSPYLIEGDGNGQSLEIDSLYSGAFRDGEILEMYYVHLSAGAPYRVTMDPGASLDASVYLFNPDRLSGSRQNYDFMMNAQGSGVDEELFFTPTHTGYWGIVVVNENGVADGCGVAVWSYGSPTGNFLDICWGKPTNWALQTLNHDWCGIAMRTDLDMIVDDDGDFSSPIVRSEYPDTNYEFAVINGHTWGDTPIYARLDPCSTGPRYVTEAEWDITDLTVGVASSNDMEDYGLYDFEVIDMYEVYLTTGHTYRITLDLSLISLSDLSLYAFNPTRSSGSRETADLVADEGGAGLEGDEQLTFTASTDGFYAIVVANDSNFFTHYTIEVDDVDVAPPDVTEFTATPGEGQIGLSWTNPAASDFMGVRILRKEGDYPQTPTDGIVVYDGSGTSCVDTGLTNETTYYYTAFSYDEAPNYSGGTTVSSTPVDFETVGYTTVFPCISYVANRRAMPFVMSQAGSLTSISIYHQGGTGDAILAVYRDTAGRPGTRLGVTDSTPIHSTEGWQAIALQSPVVVSASQAIWLAWVFESDPGMRWTEGTPGRAISTATWSGGMPGDFGTSTLCNGIYSIYATYSPEGDVIPPGNVTALTVTPGDGQISLSWTDPGDTDFAGVKILRKEGTHPENPMDGTVVYDGPGTTHVDTGLTNNTTYYYTAFSYDDVPNYSSGARVDGTPAADGIDETIGYTTVFPKVSTVAQRRAMPFAVSQAGSLASISIYHQGGSGHAILAVYSDASGRPGTRLGMTDSTTIRGTEGWQTFALQSPVAVSPGQTIWLAWVFENDPGMRWVEGSPGRATSTATWSCGMPESFGASSVYGGIYSIYATYRTGEDVTPPGNVTGLTATPGNGQVSLSWTNPSDADFVGVKILRKTGGSPTGPSDGTLVYDGGGASCVDTGLTNGTRYYYTAFSYDDAANYSSGATADGTPVAEGVDETIGYTTVFPNISVVANRRAMPFVAGAGGSLASISIYHQAGTGHAILAVYSDASGRPGTRLGLTDSTLIHSTEGWQTIALQSPVAVSIGQTIWLAWVFENDPGMRWTEGSPGRAMSTAIWSDGMPENFGASSVYNGIYSVYATYGA